MTDAKVLADALVEAGILGTETVQGTQLYTFAGDPHVCPAETWITDWRVAGKVLEQCSHADLYWDEDFRCDLVVGIGKNMGLGSVGGYARLELPRAIIEAWYEKRQ